MRELSIDNIVCENAYNHLREKGMQELSIGESLRVVGFKNRSYLLSVCGQAFLGRSQQNVDNQIGHFNYIINESNLTLTIKRTE